jgi:hypothetical protein
VNTFPPVFTGFLFLEKSRMGRVRGKWRVLPKNVRAMGGQPNFRFVVPLAA